MRQPSIEVILACQCMGHGASQINWIPSEYVAISPTEAATLFAQHLTTHHPEEITP
jgi:hypothetical protein